eukprot:gene12928-3683_t
MAASGEIDETNEVTSNIQEGIEPMWEDERNRLGGRWLINVNKGNRNAELDRLWLELLLILVGEAFGDDHDSVTGAVVQKRNKGDKIGLWTCKSDEQDSILRIGKFVKERLSLTGKNSIGYQTMDNFLKSGLVLSPYLTYEREWT